MKVALISDTHGHLPKIPTDADFVLHAGDVCPERDQESWLSGAFYRWARETDRPFYGTWGNHDRGAEKFPHCVQLGVASFHVDRSVEIHGLKVWFSPWSTRFGDWAWMKNEDALSGHYDQIPLDTQVIVTHQPPRGHCDRSVYFGGFSAGSPALRHQMRKLRDLRLVVCGHIHEARGESGYGPLRVVNASIMDEHYDPIHDPVAIEWPV